MPLTREQKLDAVHHAASLHFAVTSFIESVNGLVQAGALSAGTGEEVNTSARSVRLGICLEIGKVVNGDDELIALFVERGLLPAGYTQEIANAEAERGLLTPHTVSGSVN